MEASKISRLRHEQEKAFSETEEQIKKFAQFKSDYKILQSRLNTLPDKLSHDVMVPFGKMAFMPGKIVKTNEILVLLGDNWFAEQSAKQASQIADRRITELDKRIKSLKQQQKLLESRFGFTSELKDMAEGKGDYKEIVEEYDEEKEKLWDEKHRESVRRYQEKLKKEKDCPKLVNAKGDCGIQSPALPMPSTTDDDIWSRLDALEEQEDERGELNSSFDSSDDERGSNREDKTVMSTQHRNVVWQDEREIGKDSSSSSSSNDSDDGEEEEEDEDGDEEGEEEHEKRKPVVKTITFSHSKVPATNPNKPVPDSSAITSPGEIYKLFCPKSILRKSRTDNAESSHVLNTRTKSHTASFDLPDGAGDYDEGNFHTRKNGSADVLQPAVGGLGDVTSSKEKAFTGVVMENLVKETAPSSLPQAPAKRVSKFKAQRMGQKHS